MPRKKTIGEKNWAKPLKVYLRKDALVKVERAATKAGLNSSAWVRNKIQEWLNAN